ncbi:branched-chain amino acid ABC transporter permease [uncultured Selenomonas sp.]|uniref:branched-chain amino acid ABC transporter permease n=1 Tax=uncultured Selenomonas sp. TaxID=159275 RepID=UPI0028D78C0A|nr:branched-chain amino acid ABC transporter permease [uncultured Selenomonas sp.]
MNASQKNDLKMLVFALVIYALVMGLTSAGMLSAFWQLNLIFAGINIILAASLNLINGYTGQFSLGHAGFMAVGAYVGVVLTTNFHLPFAAAILAGGTAAGLLGALIGLPTLRLRGDYLAIATLGLGEIVRIVIINVPYVGGAAGFKGIPHLTDFTWVFFLMLASLYLIKNFVNARHGRACLAIRENEIAAESMGIHTTRYKVLAFTIGAAFAGVAGVLFGHNMYILSPASFTFMQSFNILIMVVMGGLGSMTGSIAGALVVTFLSAALASFPNARMIIYALALILLMFYRPQGLFGYVEITAMQPLRRFFRKDGEAQ